MPTPSEEEFPAPNPEPIISKEEHFCAQYKVLRTIGKGSCGKVVLAHHRLTGTPVAIKVIVKNRHWFQREMTEANIMKKIDHPNIISLKQVIETKQRLYLVMELAEGKQLYQYIKECGHIEEDEARDIFKQIVAAVNYCHEHGIIHRDLKPDNIMIDRNGKVKIIDFGLSIVVQPGQLLDSYCGAYAFGAPEMFLGHRYDGAKSDIWTLGVNLYQMVVGKLPFDTLNIQELRKQVLEGVYPGPWGVSKELDDLISLLLTPNPRYRPTITEVMKHPWLKENWKAFPQPSVELPSLCPQPEILQVMKCIGFQAQDINNSIINHKYNETMATYYFLQAQALQGYDCPTRAQLVSPVTAPFPSLEDNANFKLGLKRSESLPVLNTRLFSSTQAQLSAYGQKTSTRGGRVSSVHCRLLHGPIKKTTTQDQGQERALSVPCINSKSRLSDKSCGNKNPEENLTHTNSAEDKPIPSRGRPRGFKARAKQIGKAIRKLFCCLPKRREPRLGQSRVSSQE